MSGRENVCVRAHARVVYVRERQGEKMCLRVRSGQADLNLSSKDRKL